MGPRQSADRQQYAANRRPAGFITWFDRQWFVSQILTVPELRRQCSRGAVQIRDLTVLATEAGFICEYNPRVWAISSIHRIAAYAMAYDTHHDTKESRRKEAANYVRTYNLRHHVEWRQIGPHEVPVYNGVYDLRIDQLRPHCKEDYLQAVPATSYIPGRECPTWLAALRLYWGEDPDYEAEVAALQEFFGYC